jgi:hypothetical protein
MRVAAEGEPAPQKGGPPRPRQPASPRHSHAADPTARGRPQNKHSKGRACRSPKRLRADTRGRGKSLPGGGPPAARAAGTRSPAEPHAAGGSGVSCPPAARPHSHAGFCRAEAAPGPTLRRVSGRDKRETRRLGSDPAAPPGGRGETVGAAAGPANGAAAAPLSHSWAGPRPPASLSPPWALGEPRRRSWARPRPCICTCTQVGPAAAYAKSPSINSASSRSGGQQDWRDLSLPGVKICAPTRLKARQADAAGRWRLLRPSSRAQPEARTDRSPNARQEGRSGFDLVLEGGIAFLLFQEVPHKLLGGAAQKPATRHAGRALARSPACGVIISFASPPRPHARPQARGWGLPQAQGA